ncbi:hypothetical protein V8F20_001388 [Naviculisporaceae sp. PSN 640]
MSTNAASNSGSQQQTLPNVPAVSFRNINAFINSIEAAFESLSRGEGQEEEREAESGSAPDAGDADADSGRPGWRIIEGDAEVLGRDYQPPESLITAEEDLRVVAWLRRNHPRLIDEASQYQYGATIPQGALPIPAVQAQPIPLSRNAPATSQDRVLAAERQPTGLKWEEPVVAYVSGISTANGRIRFIHSPFSAMTHGQTFVPLPGQSRGTTGSSGENNKRKAPVNTGSLSEADSSEDEPLAQKRQRASGRSAGKS